MPRGYNCTLYFLPFDHRASFEAKIFGWTGELNPAQTTEIATAKRVIHDGFKMAIAGGIPEVKAKILVYEQFGEAILRDAKAEGWVTACAAEKSGQEECGVEYGEDFAHHIVSG
jgi:myo-inositol catabolism protein IolC